MPRHGNIMSALLLLDEPLAITGMTCAVSDGLLKVQATTVEPNSTLARIIRLLESTL